jgi:hypothetical protein
MAETDEKTKPRIGPDLEFRSIHISGYDRQSHDFYPTPDWVTAVLLKHVTLNGPVWEPCCGDGAMARVISQAGHEVVATDLVDRGFGRGGVDIFQCTDFPPGCRALVTNPPYGDGGEMVRASNASLGMLKFVRHALDLTIRANGQLALLVRFQWLAGKRAATLISSGPLDSVIVLTKRIQWFDRGERTTTGQHHHAWVFWDCTTGRAAAPQLLFSDLYSDVEALNLPRQLKIPGVDQAGGAT